MSDFDFSMVEPILNKWLLTQINIDGYGVAEFEKPKGVLKGPVTVRVDESGEEYIEMKVKKIITKEELPLGIDQLLSGDEPEQKGNELFLTLPPSKNNKCLKLTVVTDEGRFIAENFDYYFLHRSFSSVKGNKDKIIFSPSNLRFITDNKNKPLYWVMPLTNYVTNFIKSEVRLARHPLRIYQDGKLPEDIPEDKKAQAKIIAQSKNQLIVFEFLEKLAFIEGLPDYDERVKKIENQRSPTVMTSVMVGEVGDNNINHECYENWFPFILLDVLSFATGTQVGTPWIEFRDKEGKLIARYFGMFRKPYFIKGARIIDEGLHRGTTELLNCSLHSPVIHESYFRSAMLLITNGGKYQQSIEDKLSYLCRAFESLCAHFGYKTQNLLPMLNDKNKGKVQGILKKADQQLQTLTDQTLGDSNQQGVLKRIRGNLSNVANINKQFGLSVVDLLEKFNLPDSDIIDAYFQVNSRKDNITSWSALISKYRGVVIHEGYFNFRGNEYIFEDVWTVIQHLHDLLARIVLMSLGYKGKYQPTVIKVVSSLPVDWVKPNTSPVSLGYAKGQVKNEFVKISVKLPDEKVDNKKDM